MSDSHDTEVSFSLCRNSVSKAYLIAYSNADAEVIGRNMFSPAIFQSFQSDTASAVTFNQSDV